jgi:hypothetical protein
MALTLGRPPFKLASAYRIVCISIQHAVGIDAKTVLISGDCYELRGN